MFVGRSRELEALNRMYNSGRFECAIVYGRRRVGKTTLIKEFIKGRNAVYFLAREADGNANLSGFSADVYTVTAPGLRRKASFSDWENAFEYIGQVSQDTRMVLVIDEYPYLAGGYPPISSIIQAHIDTRLKDGKLFLILCGSSMSFMEHQVLGYKSPLYGRRTAQFKVLPFDYFESQLFLDTFDEEERATVYGFTGGVPDYLDRIDPAKTVRENIIDAFLTPSGRLYEEPANLLKQELREPAVYNSLIGAIAGGASRLNEIAGKSGMESNKCAKYLASLMALGIVKKEFPVTGAAASRKTLYRLDDLMFRFWYRFVFPNMSAVMSGLGEAVYDLEIAGRLPAYMGLVFEEICRQYLTGEARRGALPFLPGRVGRWWGGNPKEKRQEEIDILAYRNDSALFCECKWTNAPVDLGVLNDLMAQSRLFSFKHQWFWLFAKTGFTDALARESERLGNVRLVRFSDMAPG
ncbi:MAG: ATP-binding protein [Methylobacteriaceae bacterium]|jgi:AAA+ ATPase superfamily predicted ATPase|nr:ATP-binding protein [Methylobacteriaceae bacterium]